jgi:ribonucleoside-diphosphate reductase alpha chain
LEQGLPGWGVCNLSAINLSKFVKDNDVDWESLGTTVRHSVRFLDNVVDATPYHFPENEANQKKERRIGLGTMGLAEMMIHLKIRYGSPESLEFLDKLYNFIAREAYLASTEIAAEKGSFPAFDADLFLQSGFMKQFDDEVRNAVKERGMRNVTVLTQAPTGSTGTMVGTSTGIEPFYAFEYYRQSRLGFDKQYVPIAKKWLEENNTDTLPDYFVSAMDLSAEDHVRVQAAIQKWVDSSISKTANAPHDFTVEETKALYELAFDLGCKGVTIYRDGSRDVQVLTTKADEKEEKKENKQETKAETVKPAKNSNEVAPTKDYRRRPLRLKGATYKMKTPLGKAYITVNEVDGAPFEVIVNVGKAGSDVFAMSEALGRVSTLFLRFGELPDGNKARLLIKHLKGIGGSGAVGFGANRVDSIPDAVAKAIEFYLDGDEEDVVASASESASATAAPRIQERDEDGDIYREGLDLCPECGAAALVAEEGCKHCEACGYSRCS